MAVVKIGSIDSVCHYMVGDYHFSYNNRRNKIRHADILNLDIADQHYQFHFSIQNNKLLYCNEHLRTDEAMIVFSEKKFNHEDQTVKCRQYDTLIGNGSSWRETKYDMTGEKIAETFSKNAECTEKDYFDSFDEVKVMKDFKAVLEKPDHRTNRPIKKAQEEILTYLCANIISPR